jgi:hypothetical protein
MRWVVIVSVISTAVLLHATARAEAGTTYYIDNQAGSNCSDAGLGTSPDTPWCDFTPVNSRTFGPGDRILLARRATWDQQMTLNGSGAATNYASVDAYGSGPRPRIIRNGNESDRAIRMNDPSYWSVSNLEIGSAGTGILVYFYTLYHAGLQFDNIYVHDIRGIHQGDTASGRADRIWNSAGIEITGLVTATSAQYALSDVTLSNIEGTHNMDSVSFDWFNGLGTTDGGDGHTLVRNVTLDHLYLHDDNGPAAGCDEGMRLVDMMNVVILDSILNDEAACHSHSGTAAVIFGRLQNVTLVNSIETNVPNTQSSDMTGFDYEASNDQVRVRDSYIGGNAGAGIELLALHGSADHSISEIAGNVFVGDGNGAVRRYLSMSYPTGTIRDNLYDEPAGFLTNYGADFNAFTVTNNIRVSVSLISNAAHDFSGTQGANDWSYQDSADGTTWTALTYDGTMQAWTPSVSATVPLITQFDQHPETCPTCHVARVWTAPRAGTLSIRGRLLKSDVAGGDGIGARITKNGVTIWGPVAVAYNDQVGVEANMDNLFVAPGDVIRFVVDNGGSGNNEHDLTSWDPSVAYIPAGIPPA